MTLYEGQLLSGRYAKAFITLFAKQLTLEINDAIAAARDFFKKHIQALMVADLFNDTVQHSKLIKLLTNELPPIDGMKALVTVLLKDKRLALLPNILNHIYKSVLEQHHIMPCTIQSFPELTVAQKELVVDIFGKKIGYKVRPSFGIDSTLIAGICITSELYTWEYSVDKQMRELERILSNNFH
jgi:F0F1-type ATP synthase delta subunit